jgi:hypothetical protein
MIDLFALLMIGLMMAFGIFGAALVLAVIVER